MPHETYWPSFPMALAPSPNMPLLVRRKVVTTWVAGDIMKLYINTAINLLFKVSHPNHVWRSNKIDVKSAKGTKLKTALFDTNRRRVGSTWDASDMKLKGFFTPIPNRNSNNRRWKCIQECWRKNASYYLCKFGGEWDPGGIKLEL